MVTLVPHYGWGGDGLLGCSIEWSDTDRSMNGVWQIMGVTPQSPAVRAGFRKLRDYIIGMQDYGQCSDSSIHMFTSSTDVHTRLNSCLRQHQTHLLVLLYDSVRNDVREALLQLSNSGDAFGLDIANGFLHSIHCPTDRIPTIRPDGFERFIVNTSSSSQSSSSATLAVVPADSAVIEATTTVAGLPSSNHHPNNHQQSFVTQSDMSSTATITADITPASVVSAAVDDRMVMCTILDCEEQQRQHYKRLSELEHAQELCRLQYLEQEKERSGRRVVESNDVNSATVNGVVMMNTPHVAS
jgi:hypothetical protein